MGEIGGYKGREKAALHWRERVPFPTTGLNLKIVQEAHSFTMKTALILSALVLQAVATAIPPHARPPCGKDEAHQRQEDAQRILDRRLKSLHIKKTTKTPGGQVIDWIPLESQGKIASPPSKLERLNDADPMMPDNQATFELDGEKVPRGPAGTVPVLRPNLASLNFSLFSLDDFFRKKLETDGTQGNGSTGGGDESAPRVKRQGTFNPEPHWYSKAYEFVTNYGAQGQFSVFEPTTEANEFSLMQMAVVSEGVGAVKQTLEAGTIVQKGRYNDVRSHLFTFFTTNGYGAYGDNVQGWNREFKGWVQVDGGIFPGCILQPPGTIGGQQYKSWIVYRLYQGNWWLWVKDRWIGYYPASLFSAGQPDATKTLAANANKISMYGEVTDRNTMADQSFTTTDMGSGQYANTGFGRSGYIHNLLYYAGTTNDNTRYGKNARTQVDDSVRYSLETHFDNTGSWDSFMWLGGPGRV